MQSATFVIRMLSESMRGFIIPICINTWKGGTPKSRSVMRSPDDDCDNRLMCTAIDKEIDPTKGFQLPPQPELWRIEWLRSGSGRLCHLVLWMGERILFFGVTYLPNFWRAV